MRGFLCDELVARDLQRLLIKALEEKKYVPLGDDRPKKSDFRLITATNVGNEELRERLDPDFLDRISMVTLHIPPLREIRDEVQWLWRSAYRQAAARAGVEEDEFDERLSRRLVERISCHPLPGNLRDLFRVAYRLLAASGDPDAPLKGDDAVDYALDGLSVDDAHADTPAAALARAFADKQPIDGMVDAGPICTRDLDREMKAFVASELRRRAKERGVPVERLCDVTERTLRSWIDPSRKE